MDMTDGRIDRQTCSYFCWITPYVLSVLPESLNHRLQIFSLLQVSPPASIYIFEQDSAASETKGPSAGRLGVEWLDIRSEESLVRDRLFFPSP